MRERDQLTPREVAERTGFSYHAVLRAIDRGDLEVCEPIPGRLRIEFDEYERWRRTPRRKRASDRVGRSDAREPSAKTERPRLRRANQATYHDELRAIEGTSANGPSPQAEREMGAALARGWPIPLPHVRPQARRQEQFDADRRRRKQLGQAAIPEDVPLREFVKTYWRLHAIPNLADSTRDFYARTLSNHIVPRLGDYGVRELTPKRLARFREGLERDAGTATVRKAMAILQSILSFAVAEELVEFNAAAAVRKPRYERAREPRIFLPAEVEQIRAELPSVRDRTLVSVLAYSGPRPEEVVCRLAWDDIGERAIRYRDTKRHRERFTPLLAPLAEDLRKWFLACGRPSGSVPVFPPTTAASGAKTTGPTGAAASGNPAKRTYKRDGRVKVYKGTLGCAPPGTRPRDLRSSYVTLRVYEGVPLTTIARGWNKRLDDREALRRGH